MLTDWAHFLGRFHPLFIHLPIGIILFAALLSILSAYKKNTVLNSAVSVAMLAGGISAVLAAVSGYLLSQNGSYSARTIAVHKWTGIAMTVILFTAWWLRGKKADRYIWKLRLSGWLLGICIILITIGGHFGGILTHGNGYLTRYMPGSLQSLLGAETSMLKEKPPPPLDSVVVYRDIIQPLLKEKCIGCHNPDKRSGNLDLSSARGLAEGGKSGKAVVAGDPQKSELFARITLPAASKKMMPLDNAPLKPVEIGLIQQWILSGADEKKNIAQEKADEKKRYLIAAYLGIAIQNDKEIVLPAAPVANAAAAQALSGSGLLISPVALNSNLLEVSFIMKQHSDASEITRLLQQLSALAPQVYRLNMAGCQLNGEGIKIISGFNRLHRLELQKCNLTSEMVQPLAELQQLELLNIGQNNLTDAGLEVFKKMAGLRTLNVWQNPLTAQGGEALVSALKGRSVVK